MMSKELSVIEELRAIRREKERLLCREAELSKSLLSDLELIPEIYRWYTEIQTNRKHPLGEETTKFQKEFVYLITFLYSPITLAGGGIMSRGVRQMVAGLLGFKSPTHVSNLFAGAVLEYNTYKDFKRDIRRIYALILERLQVEGVV